MPREGDLLYMPMNGKIFQIMFVEDEKMFYPQGKLMVFELTVELFERSHEDFNTGNTSIDGVETIYPQSNIELSIPEDNTGFGVDMDNIMDFSEDNPFSEEW